MGVVERDLASGHIWPQRDDGFAALYRAYFPRLVMVVRDRLQDEALAEDIAQEALVRAYSRIDELDPSRPVWPWLKTVALNLSIDHVRKRAREVVSEVSDDSNVEKLDFEECDLLARAMQELPNRQRVAMSLRYLDDWDNAQVASFLGLTKTGFEQLLHRARKKLHFHYHRLSREAWGLLALPIGRRLWGRRTQRVASVGEPLGQLAAVAPQIAHVVVAAVVTFSAVPSPIHLPGPIDKSAQVPAVASKDEGTRSPSRRGDGTASASQAVFGGSRGNASTGTPLTTEAGGVTAADSPERVDRINNGLNRNKNVRNPEDAYILSLASSPNFTSDRTIFATGSACGLPSCTRVLFRSRDGGSTWKRLPSENLLGDAIGIPAGYGLVDRRIFAMGPGGLQVSTDGGNRFDTAAVSGAPYAVGSMAISPAFTSSDPSILIGSQTMMRYDDVNRTITPAPYTSLPGPLEPAYSPGYPADPRIIVGAMKPGGPGLVSVVYRCTDVVCEDSFIGPYGMVPKVRLAPDFAASDTMIAFLSDHLFLSRDGGASFLEMNFPFESTSISDVAVGRAGRQVFVALNPIRDRGPAGIFVTSNLGRSWTKLRSPLLAQGTDNLAMAGSTIIAGLADTGLACSTDYGRTWARRCR